MGENRGNVNGEIILKSSNEVEWKIANVYLFSQKEDYFLDSPSFPYLDGMWCLKCWTNCSFRGIFLALMRIHSTSHYNITFRVGIKVKERITDLSQLITKTFTKDGERGVAGFRVNRIYLEAHITSFFCKFSSVSSKETVSQTVRSEGIIEYAERNSVGCIKEDGDEDATKLEFNTKIGIIEYTERNSVGCIEKDGEDDETKLKFTTKIGVNSLVQNLKDLLSREDQCDILVKVKDKEFKAHKLMLGARSSVFSAMFAYDTLEKRTNIIEITDCDPDAFMQFLIYLYTGQVERVPGDQVIDLYCIADKYNVEELKEACASFMKEHMTVETFCDVMSLALCHNEMALIDSATKYFVENVMKIIVTAKWITFVKQNPVESNELHIKYLNYGNKK